MADDEALPAAALPVTTVQAWRAHVGAWSGGGVAGEAPGEVLGDVVVLELGVEGATLPPLLIPVGSVAGLAVVLLQAAGVDVMPDGSGPGASGSVGGPGGGLLEPGLDPDADPIAALPEGSPWAALAAAERVRADELSRATLPSGPGAYVWFRQGVPIHLGRAVGKRGLRARIGSDALRGDADLSRSPFRAAVAHHLGFGPDGDGGPAHLGPCEVARLDAWIAGCQVAWLRAATPAQATHVEASLRTDHDPSLDPLP